MIKRLLTVWTAQYLQLNTGAKPPRRLDLQLVTLAAWPLDTNDDVTQLGIQLGSLQGEVWLRTKDAARVGLDFSSNRYELYFSFTTDESPDAGDDAFRLTGILHDLSLISCYNSEEAARAAL